MNYYTEDVVCSVAGLVGAVTYFFTNDLSVLLVTVISLVGSTYFEGLDNLAR